MDVLALAAIDHVGTDLVGNGVIIAHALQDCADFILFLGLHGGPVATASTISQRYPSLYFEINPLSTIKPTHSSMLWCGVCRADDRWVKLHKRMLKEYDEDVCNASVVWSVSSADASVEIALEFLSCQIKVGE